MSRFQIHKGYATRLTPCLTQKSAAQPLAFLLHSYGLGEGLSKGLRHAFAVAGIGQNIPLPTIQKWMGHARLETTAIYLAVSGDEERKLAKRLWNRD